MLSRFDGGGLDRDGLACGVGLVEAEVDAEGVSETFGGDGRGLGLPALDATDVSLLNARELAQLALGKAAAMAQRQKLPGDVEVALEQAKLGDGLRPFGDGLLLYVLHQLVEIAHGVVLLRSSLYV